MRGRRQNSGGDNTWVLVLVVAAIGYFMWRNGTLGTSSVTGTSGTVTQPVPGATNNPIMSQQPANTSGVDLAALEGQWNGPLQVYPATPSDAPPRLDQVWTTPLDDPTSATLVYRGSRAGKNFVL